MVATRRTRPGLEGGACLALALLVLTRPAGAQQGTLEGSVVTESGLTVQSAQIDVLGPTLGTTVLSDAEGRYRVDLPAGEYDLVVTSVGARRLRIDNVSVGVRETTTLDIVVRTRVEELDGVQVTASRGIAERETESVATVHTVGSVEIAERSAQTLADHIRPAPGVDVITHGLQATNVVLRGFNNIFSGSLHMLTDYRLAGVPSLRVNLMHFLPANAQDVDRMEVALGPGSALYGPNTASGVVHVLTRSPLGSEGTTVTLGGGEQSLFQGSFRSAWSPSERLGFKVSGQYLRGNEWPHVDPTEEDARLQAVLDRPTCLADKRLRGLSAPDADAVCDRVGIRRLETERWGGEVRADWRFGDDGTVVATYGRTDASGIELTGLGAGQADSWIYEFYQVRASAGRLFAQAYTNRSDAGDTYLLQSGMPLIDRSRLDVAQVQHGVELAEGRQDLTYGVDWFGTRPRTDGTINGIYEPDDAMDEWGLYLQSRTALTDRLDLVLAGRRDDHSLLDEVWSPRAALVFRPAEQQSVRFAYNRAFSTPSSLNYFLDLSAGFAPEIGPLGYSLRAFGTGRDGWSLQPDGVTRIRSPFIGGGTVLAPPPDPSTLWASVVGTLERQGVLDAATAVSLAGSPPAPGSVAWMLFDPNTSAVQPLAGAVLPEVPAIREGYTESFELGWTGVLDNRLKVSADVYRTTKNDFVSPLLVQTPLLTMNAADLLAHLSPLVGPAALPLASAFALLPLGVVSSDEIPSETADVVVTYRNVGDVTVWGGDLAFQWFVTDRWTASGAYSWVSDDYFEIEGGDPIALNAPRHKGNLGLAHRNVDRGFAGGLRLRLHNSFPAESAGFVGTRCVTGAPLGLFDEECVGGAVLLDANLGLRLPGSDATLLASVTNMFDVSYRSFVGVPAIGRMATLSVRYELF